MSVSHMKVLSGWGVLLHYELVKRVLDQDPSIGVLGPPIVGT